MTATTSESLAGSGIDEAACAAEVAALETKSTRVETPCGDGTMVWRVWGEGRPLVLSHGSAGDWTHWIRNIEPLARHYRVIALDLPGHGQSARPHACDQPTLGGIIARGLREVLKPGERADLVGFSYGGVCLAHAAAQAPDLSNSLAMIGSGGLATPVGQIALTRVRGLAGKARAEAHRFNLLGLMLHNESSVDDMAIYLTESRAAMCRMPMRDLEIMPDYAMPALERLACPFNGIWGAHDRAHPDPDDQLRLLRKVLPDPRMHVIADAGHWAIYEQPEAFNAVLLKVLSELAPVEA